MHWQDLQRGLQDSGALNILALSLSPSPPSALHPSAHSVP